AAGGSPATGWVCRDRGRQRHRLAQRRRIDRRRQRGGGERDRQADDLAHGVRGAGVETTTAGIDGADAVRAGRERRGLEGGIAAAIEGYRSPQGRAAIPE